MAELIYKELSEQIVGAAMSVLNTRERVPPVRPAEQRRLDEIRADE